MSIPLKICQEVLVPTCTLTQIPRCPSSTILQVYNACIHSVLIYVFPFFCNCSISLQKKLLAIEKRAFRIMHLHPDQNLLDVANSQCFRFFDSIECYADHPLRCMFDERNPTPRNSKTLRIPKGRKKRFTSSLFRFSR